ncbi:MAG: YkgJ family cysteine cluster protein [Bacteroidales bacterium]|nr:YkgJ family cysteine cluster protein [Bacteroidales bacterium]
MKYNPKQIKADAEKLQPAAKQLFKKIRKSPKNLPETLFHKYHESVFMRIDCLECANCCKNLGPLVTYNDLEKMASFLKTKPSFLLEKYFITDEDGDIVFKSMPCPFLLPDNYCSIYEARPKACKEYPHTNHKKIVQILDITLKNMETCPAVLEIVKGVVKEF